MRSEQRFYGKLTCPVSPGLESFEPESFHPFKGTILAVQPPPLEETEGGIVIPEASREDQVYAVIAAVPDDPKCPVTLGQTVVLRQGAGVPARFGKRTDLVLLSYTSDSSAFDSDIIGVLDNKKDESDNQPVAKDATKTPEPAMV